jgi:hypothetical protein
MPDQIDHQISSEAGPVELSRWIRVAIPVGVGLFILALTVSAVVIPQLRLLHLLQALIYIAIVLLTYRNSPWGFGVAVFISIAWNCLNMFVTHLFEAGAAVLWSFVRTGHLIHPDTAMVFLGCIAHFLLIVACMAGFLQFRPGKKQWTHFFTGGLLGLAYMALIIIIAAPR